MIAFSHPAFIAFLCSSAAIAAVTSGSEPQPNAFWVPFEPQASVPAAISAQLPAGPSATTVPQPSGVPVLSSSWDLALPNPSDGSLSTPIVYNISDTDKSIQFTNIYSPLPDATVLMCFLQASEDILNKTISLGKDGFIDGGKFTAQYLNETTDYITLNVMDNFMTGQKVTYGTLQIALRGLGAFMTAQNSFFETKFGIFDGQWGQVGYGSIVGSSFSAAS